MGLTEIVQSKGWKMFMAKLYGFGAAVVIVGALFKIMHWPFAGPMLIAGLSTEAIIFFFSAFEPLHEEDDWSLVYPQLGGLGESDEIPMGDKPSKNVGGSLAKFDEMIEGAHITPEVFQRLGSGLNNLNETAGKLADISDATVATNEYTSSMKSASLAVNALSDTNKKASQQLETSVSTLSDSYTKNAKLISQSGSDLATSYQSMIDSMSIDFTAVARSNKSYSEELDTINKNLSALNAVYELQLQNANDSLQRSQKFYAGLDNMMTDMKDASKESENYRLQIQRLGKQLEALNTVYGKMLTAMNVTSV